MPAVLLRAEPAEFVIVAHPFAFMAAGLMSQLGPALAAGLRWGRMPAARRWIGATFAFMFLLDCAAWLMAGAGRSNLWLMNLGNPVTTSGLLLAFRAWHDSPRIRRLFAVAIPAYVVCWALVFVSAENASDFSRFTRPMQSFVVVIAAGATLLYRSRADLVPPWFSDVFWVATGLIIDFGATAVLEPFSAMVIRDHPSLVVSAYVAKACVSVLAYTLVTAGVLCPTRVPSSGGFSSSPDLRYYWS